MGHSGHLSHAQKAMLLESQEELGAGVDVLCTHRATLTKAFWLCTHRHNLEELRARQPQAPCLESTVQACEEIQTKEMERFLEKPTNSNLKASGRE